MATKDEKTEDATGRRKEDAKKKGDVPRSKDLSAAVGLMLTLLFFSLSIPSMGRIILASFKIYFNNAGSIRMTETSMYFVGKDIFITFLKLTGPLFILLFFIAVAMEMIYAGGIQILGERLKIKWEKVFFLPEIPKGLKKILISTEALMDLFKSIVKVIVVAFIAYHTIRIYIPVVMELPQTSMENILVVMGRIFARLTFNITLFFLALALLDYIWQMHRHKEKLKMTKNEVKDERKQMDGDPKIKAKQKRIQFQQALNRMMAQVPEADVVITNPTHYATALKYEFKKMHSPQLLAKGKDLLAQRIKEVAKEHNIPVVENPPVARALFASVEVGDFVPAELFKPIAEILAYIFKLKGKKIG